jgi:hypothetical protein
MDHKRSNEIYSIITDNRFIFNDLPIMTSAVIKRRFIRNERMHTRHTKSSSESRLGGAAAHRFPVKSIPEICGIEVTPKS